MRPGLRFILLLILSIALRGLSGVAYALPVPATQENLASVQLSAIADCPDHAANGAALAHTHHQPGDKACQISCDLAVSPALPASSTLATESAPDGVTSTLSTLSLGSTLPPDHPPPIR
jgi:hypothetical protein